MQSTSNSILIVYLNKDPITDILVMHTLHRSHTGPLFANNYLLTVTDMHKLELGLFMYRIRYLINYLPSSSKIEMIHTCNYSTRQVNDLDLTCNKTLFSDQGIRTSGPILWNSLPTFFKES